MINSLVPLVVGLVGTALAVYSLLKESAVTRRLRAECGALRSERDSLAAPDRPEKTLICGENHFAEWHLEVGGVDAPWCIYASSTVRTSSDPFFFCYSAEDATALMAHLDRVAAPAEARRAA